MADISKAVRITKFVNFTKSHQKSQTCTREVNTLRPDASCLDSKILLSLLVCQEN